MSSFKASLPSKVEESCCARIGLIGNPSDGFHGKTVSFLINNFRATVHITENNSKTIEIIETTKYADLKELQDHSTCFGYTGGLRLLKATCKVFATLCSDANISVHLERGFKMMFSTNIPRMVGLSGSSAIIVAAFRGLLRFYGLTISDLKIRNVDLPEIILGIEKQELGISAGLQDRVIQTYGGLVHMDFSHRIVEESKIRPDPVYTSLDPLLLPQMYLVYDFLFGGDSGKVHSTVRTRWEQKDPVLLKGMEQLGKLADLAVTYLEEKNYKELAILMDKNFALRREMYGDEVVGEKNIRIAGLAKTFGLSSKFTGSGGAFVCLRRSGEGWFTESEEDDIKEQFLIHGFKFVRVEIPKSS